MKDLELVSVSQARSSNLAFALLCLPRARRVDAMLFYRFCRTIDDIADRLDFALEEKKVLLDAWLAALDSRLPCGLEDLLDRHAIDRGLLGEIVRGCASDLQPLRFDSISALELYCWRVACAVGLVSIKIFGCRDSESADYAIQLGHALQLTNILRDVGEDARQGRIYIPLEVLARFGVSEEEILSLSPGPRFRALIGHMGSLARARFAAALPPKGDFGRLLPARIMGAVYQKILDRLEKEDFPVFQRRVALSPAERLACLIGAWRAKI